jgi:hypothetical protein
VLITHLSLSLRRSPSAYRRRQRHWLPAMRLRAVTADMRRLITAVTVMALDITAVATAADRSTIVAADTATAPVAAAWAERSATS